MSRNVVLALGIGALFAAAVMVLLALFPRPLRPADLMVIGAVSTMLCLLALFFAITKVGTPPAAKRTEDPDRSAEMSEKPDTKPF